ncbi:DUF5667 domain-containing protein [Nocardioides sp. cx-173]|uniref:DUF5667 domain-containing protein n=1 Tax=Nocardioides sp. cx-173 TaxID=2898796 RepID=UPI001E5C5D59|nr:DUF5667 domain-containing protein [Nocardioides sp. cx-173]MCD4527345.1 DUF5667 domain-containing protein [Nocardioides sp. cx-173]UGB42390.1 DUF5667 domain-containing protein [Nocardioides sp. cx-173]
MITAFTARRRAEEFSSLVDSTSEPKDARDADLLEVVDAMRSVAPVEARPAFVSDLRERLMAAAETALAPATDAELRARLTVAPRRTPRERRLAVAIGGFAIVGATTSMAVAAQTALPGDTLYPLKRAIENARAGVQSDEGDRGSRLLHNAAGRLDEVDELTQGRGDDEAISQTLLAFSEQAGAASDLLITVYETTGEESTIAELRDFAADSLAELETLQGVIPDEARGALIQAVQVIGQIDEQALYACPTCSDAARLPQSVLNTFEQVAQAIIGDPPVTPGRGGEERPGDDGGGKDGGKDGSGDERAGPAAGATDGGPAAPASPAGPGAPAAPTPAPSAPPNPLEELTDGIKNGARPPSGVPTTLDELVEDLEDVTGDLTGPLFP